MKQFEVYDGNFYPRLGAEIKKTRNAIIVQPDSINKYQMIVIAATLKLSVKGHPSWVLSNFQNHGNEIVLDQMLVVSKSILIKKLGTVDKNIALEKKKF